MAGLCELSVRLSWIACLLIGSITCLPAPKGHGSNSPAQAAGYVGWQLPYGGSGSASGYDSGYSNAGVGSVGEVYYSSSESTEGDGAGATEVESEAVVDEEVPEPVLSDVSDLEPIYSFRSRSSYQHGRATFSQTRYTPGGVVFPPLPAVPSKQPARDPSKGGH